MSRSRRGAHPCVIDAAFDRLCCSFEGVELLDEFGDLTCDFEVSVEVNLLLVVGVDRLLLKTWPKRPGGVPGVRGVGNVEHKGVASISGVDAVIQRGESSKDSSIDVSAIALVFLLVWYCLRAPSDTILLSHRALSVLVWPVHSDEVFFTKDH